MVERIIELSVRHRWMVFGAVLVLVALGGRFRPQDAARCAAGPLRPAGHHLHRVDGAQPGSGRGPDHVSAGPCPPEHAGHRDRARLLDVRHELHLRDLRGRHRHLLGAHARARAAGARAATVAARCVPDARSRRERSGMGLPVRPEGQHRTDGSRRATGAAGLHRPARAAGRRRRGGGRVARRIRAPVPDRASIPTGSWASGSR